MNAFDLVIVALALFSLFSGWRRGFLAELGALLVLFLLPWALANFSQDLVAFWSLFLASPPIAWLASLLSIVGLLLLVGKLAGGILARLLPWFLMPLNSLAGAALALLKTLLWLGIVVSVMGKLPQLTGTALWQEAIFAQPLAALGDLIFFTLRQLLSSPPNYRSDPGELI